MTESTMELLVERAFDAPPERVYRAFTDEDQLAAWIAPAGFSAPRDSVDIDARVGGHQRFTLVGEDGSMSPVDATYTAVVENELLAGEERVAAVPGGHGEFVRTFRVEFQDAGEQTMLVLRQGPFSREAGAEARANWETAFAKLDALLSE
ncbi:MAG TPA: SRPBCC domain-containing protein [Homoserinimonas sp.]|nr:SRPBCC domain-containing protein [Homoserinimonas sp.]